MIPSAANVRDHKLREWEAGYRHGFEVGHQHPLRGDADYLDGYWFGRQELEGSAAGARRPSEVASAEAERAS